MKKIMNEKNQNEPKIEEIDKTPKNKEEIDMIDMKSKTPPMRKIWIETNGSVVNLVKNETAGSLELSAVLSALLNAIQNRRQ